jgi:hypothetical protein
VQLPEAWAATVPDGARPGEMMQFDAPDGMRMQVAVPDDKKPGDRFQVMLARHPAAIQGQASLIVPEGAWPGRLLEFVAPDGTTMQVPVPDGKKPGDLFQVQLAPGASSCGEVMLTVPKGVQPGHLVHFDAPDGTRMQTMVPEGKVPGDSFEVRLGPLPSQVDVTVPEGAVGGEEVEFQAPDGTILKAVVPHGLASGQTFRVSVATREDFVLGQLYTAAGCGDLKAAKRWAADGAPVNGVVDMGFTPLFYAATNGRAAVTAWLLEQKADVTAQCVGRRTALHWAARNGHVEVVSMLLAAKAPLDVRDRSERTPLGVAMDKNQAEVVGLLKAAGAPAK